MEVFKKDRVIKSSKSVKELATAFADFLKNSNWKVQSNIQDDKAIIQAQKPGILRDLIAADRALTFSFENINDEINVHVGVGKLLKNLAITAIEVILISEIFVVVDIPEILWTDHVEKDLLVQLNNLAQ